jgi:HemY protein
MIRLALYLLKLIVLVAAAVWIANRPGQVTIEWLGYELTTSVGVLLVALIALIVLAIFVRGLWHSLVTLPEMLTLSGASYRQRRGYLALTEGLVAISAGDAAAARKLAHKAQKYLNQPSLTLLLQAQAAQLAGDDNAASTFYNRMLEKPELSGLGLRGLVMQAQGKGDVTQALTLARRAAVVQPKAEWVHSALAELEARAGHWRAAQDAIYKLMRMGGMGPEKGKRLKATLLLAQSRTSAQNDFPVEALNLAQQAHETLPAAIAPALEYARLLLRNDKGKLASKVIERVWRTAPHPELAELYMLAGGALTPAARVQRLQQLASYNPAVTESRLAVARGAVEAQLWGIGREQLNAVLTNGEDQRALALMAELAERENHDPRAGHEWRGRAVAAPTGPRWRCGHCGELAPDWQPFCASCGKLGEIDWQGPKTPALQALPAPLALPKA